MGVRLPQELSEKLLPSYLEAKELQDLPLEAGLVPLEEEIEGLDRLQSYNAAVEETNPGLTKGQMESSKPHRAGEISLRYAVAAGIASREQKSTVRAGLGSNDPEQLAG